MPPYFHKALANKLFLLLTTISWGRWPLLFKHNNARLQGSVHAFAFFRNRFKNLYLNFLDKNLFVWDPGIGIYVKVSQVTVFQTIQGLNLRIIGVEQSWKSNFKMMRYKFYLKMSITCILVSISIQACSVWVEPNCVNFESSFKLKTLQIILIFNFFPSPIPSYTSNIPCPWDHLTADCCITVNLRGKWRRERVFPSW